MRFIGVLEVVSEGYQDESKIRENEIFPLYNLAEDLICFIIRLRLKKERRWSRY